VKIHPLVCAVLISCVAACAPALGAVVQPTSAGQVPDYDRDRFGDGWADVDGDCQDTRNEILIRDLVDEQLRGSSGDLLRGRHHRRCALLPPLGRPA
jgi:hypothetical protein